MIRAIGAIFLFYASAAIAQVGAPLLGYFPDGVSLRPVYGIPGAASIAPALNLGRDFGRIAVSPRQDYALATDASSGAVFLAIPGDASLTSLAGAGANPDLIAISPGGTAALLWFASGSHAQVVSGLPGSPSVRDIDASFITARFDNPALTDTPTALAVSDDGQWMAGAWSRGVYAIGPHSEVRPLPVFETPRAMSFFNGRHDLALATPFHVLSVAGVDGAATVSTLAGRRMNPVGIGVSSDNGHIVVGDRGGLLLSLDLNASTAAEFNCGCAPDGVFPMGRAAMFRFTGLVHGSFRMLDAAKGEILFVPVMPGQGGQP